MSAPASQRSPFAVTLAVWNALFLREAVARLSASRGAWAWIVLEPVLHVLFMLLIFTVLRARTIAGADATTWLLVGMVSFFTTQNVFQRAMGAISANAALFAYRQVRPVDTVVVRFGLRCCWAWPPQPCCCCWWAFWATPSRHRTPSGPLRHIWG